MPKDLKSWLYVIIQVVLLALLVVIPGQTNVPSILRAVSQTLEIIGAAILLAAIYDLRHSLSVLPRPVPSGRLEITGLYRYVRHPMYTAVLTLSLGIALGSNRPEKYLVFAGLVVLFTLKARYEEALLSAKYPRYSDYLAKTPRFIPWR